MKLGFSRTGKQLLAIEPGGVTAIDVASGVATELPFVRARAAVGFDTETWIATHDDRLIRLARDGAVIGDRALPGAERGRLIAAPCGEPAAVWSAAPPVMCDAAGSRELAMADAVLPLTAARVVAVRGARIALPSGLAIDLAPGSRVLDGAVTACGRIANLIVAREDRHALTAIALGTGRVLHSCVLPRREPVALGSRACAIQLAPRIVMLLDSASGRELGTLETVRDIAACAIDPGAATLAIAYDSGELELCDIGDARAPIAQARAVRLPSPRPLPIAPPAVWQLEHTQPELVIAVPAAAVELVEPIAIGVVSVASGADCLAGYLGAD